MKPIVANMEGGSVTFTQEQFNTLLGAHWEMMQQMRLATSDEQAQRHVLGFLREEENQKFTIGFSDYQTLKPFFYAIEAARALAEGEGGKNDAKILLTMVLVELSNG